MRTDTIPLLYSFVKHYDNVKIIFKLHIALFLFVWYSMNIPTKEAYQHER